MVAYNVGGVQLHPLSHEHARLLEVTFRWINNLDLIVN